MDNNKKKCCVCDSLFSRQIADSPSKWKSRKCCSPECAEKKRSQRVKIEKVYVHESKKCSICEKIFDKPYDDSHSNWKDRKCCSPECAKKARNKKNHNRFPDFTEEELRERIAVVRREKEAKGETMFRGSYEEVDFSKTYKIGSKK